MEKNVKMGRMTKKTMISLGLGVNGTYMTRLCIAHHITTYTFIIIVIIHL